MIVIGLGAMGSMTACQAASRGASVVGIERFPLAHARGSSHGGSRIYRQILFEGKEYVPLARRSLDLVRELERESGASLFARSGGLVIGTHGGPLIEDALASAVAGGVEFEQLEPDELRARFPQHAAFDDDVAVYEPGAGALRPEACITAAAEAAARAGAQIRVETPVLALRPGDAYVEVATGDETLRAKTVVLASGAWGLDLLPGVELPLRTQRSCLAWFKARQDQGDYRPESFPVFVRESRDLDGWGIPDVDGQGVKVGVGGTVQKRWLDRPEDNWEPPSAQDRKPTEDFCRIAFPGLDPRVAHATACMNSKTPDGDFIIGHVGGSGRVVFAGGFSGHGFKHSPAVGLICAQLALDGRTEFAIGKFAPNRFEDARRSTHSWAGRGCGSAGWRSAR
ncbi:N-methyl-L-tryptophan oxidase [Nonomuraea sp. NBC_00507]|uniref:N-methyl-L-tryptophan oxidase n=1 Tax=Nonomuraea sp. NBC_00507 TaxID=2976002 RepID=UPI002E178628